MTRIALADCTFTTSTDTKGRFVGHCEQFPDEHSRPHANRLDAIDTIIAQVRERLRYLDQGIDDIQAGVPR